VFVDRSALEVYVDGRAPFAAHLYPTLHESGGVAFSSTGSGARAEKLSITRIGQTV
jgi:hypothetical protein